MLEGQVTREHCQDVREQAAALLQQGEQHALAGLLPQAEAILHRVWAMSMPEEQALDLANIAAWELAWLLIRRRAYTDAIPWLCRVGAPLASSSLLWPDARRAIVEICWELANRLAEPAMTSSASIQALAGSQPASSQLPVLTITNLGRFQIIRGGKVLPSCPAHKAIALFRYLLTQHQRTAHKEELMELLWPDTSGREATNSLHVAVSTLRRYLDPPIGSYLVFQNSRYTINPDAVIEDDCAAFQQHSDEGDQFWNRNDLARAENAYLQALVQYQGDYCVIAHDLNWAISVQEQLLSRYLIVLDHVARIYIAQGRFEHAVEYYQQLVDRDGYREDAHAQLMRCYWHLNRRRDALRQYDRCAAILANDLGIEPMLEIQKLYRDISKGERPANLAL